MSFIKKAFVTLLVLFLIVFPKGGFKIGDVPITWGYILLAFGFVLVIIHILLGGGFSICVNRLVVFGAAIPFQLYILLVFWANGVQNTGFYIALLTNFIALPFLFVVVFGYHYDRMDMAYTFKVIKHAILFIAVYGIVLFIYKLITKEFIEIPYLTINADDSGMLETKFINRGALFKLISTYNNGNIYGVSLLMLLPLYSRLENNIIKKLLVYASLVLTLSRTVWIGLILFRLLGLLGKKISIKNVLLLLCSVILVGISIYYVLNYMNYNMSFLLDKNLGGRSKQLESLKHIEFITSKKFKVIAEIVYVSVLQGFGILGLIFFMMQMLAPLAVYLTGMIRYKKSAIKKSLFHGLVLYLILSCSDGAILYIPVMAFYWMITGFLLSRNPYFASDGAPHT